MSARTIEERKAKEKKEKDEKDEADIQAELQKIPMQFRSAHEAAIREKQRQDNEKAKIEEEKKELEKEKNAAEIAKLPWKELTASEKKERAAKNTGIDAEALLTGLDIPGIAEADKQKFREALEIHNQRMHQYMIQQDPALLYTTPPKYLDTKQKDQYYALNGATGLYEQEADARNILNDPKAPVAQKEQADQLLVEIKNKREALSQGATISLPDPEEISTEKDPIKIPAPLENNYAGYSFEATPPWYGGEKGILKKLMETAVKRHNEKYIPYKGERIAGLHSGQTRAIKEAQDLLDDADYKSLYGSAKDNIKEAGGASTKAAFKSNIDTGVSNALSTDILDNYMNPYVALVADKLQKRSKDHLLNDVLPQINNNFIGRGAYNSGKREKFNLKAIHEQQDSLNEALSKVLAGGYEQAVKGAEGHRSRHLTAANIIGAAETADLERKLQSGKTLEDLNTREQENRIRNIDFMNSKAAQVQAKEQNTLNTLHQDFLRQQRYPDEQLGRLSEIIRGLSPTDRSKFESEPQIPNPSPYTQLGGLAANIYGLSQMGGGKAEGGRIGYDSGGLVSEDYGVRDSTSNIMNQIESMKQRARKLEASQSHPMWGYLAALGSGIASSKNPNVAGAIGEAIPGATQGYMNIKEQNRLNEEQAENIRIGIEQSKALQAERDEKFKLDRQKFQLDNLYKNRMLSIHENQLAEQSRHHRSLEARPAASTVKDHVMLDETGRPVIARFENGIVTNINGQPVSEGQVMRGTTSEGKVISPFEEKENIKRKVEEDSKRRTKIEEEALGSTKILKSVDIMQDALDEMMTGALSEPLTKVNKYASAVGLGEGKYAAAKEIFNTQLIDLALPMVQKLRPASDQDVKWIKENIANPNMQREAAEKALEIIKADATRVTQKQKAYDAYVDKFKTSDGFESKWNQYDYNFPLTDYSSGTPKIQNLDNYDIILDPDFDKIINKQESSKYIETEKYGRVPLSFIKKRAAGE